MSQTKKNRNVGAAILFIIFGLLFFVLVIRFITIQYTGEAEGKVLAAKAAQLYMRKDVMKAQRGSIFDHNGEVIAEDTSSYTLIAVVDEKVTKDPEHPNHVQDLNKTAEELEKYLKLSKQEIYELLATGVENKRFQVEFGKAGRDLPHNVKKKVEQLKLPGISFMKDTKRFYPNGVFASHLIGYAQKENEKGKPPVIIGKTGLEKSYEDILKGKDGSIQYEGDIWNYILPNSEKQIVEPENGKNVYLTLDKKIQTFMEDAMNKVDLEYKPKRIMAIVADPKTGKILAMGQRPTYHPETREGIEKSWYNETIETTYEPGSTMKIFSLAAAIEEKTFKPDSTFESGKYYIDKKSSPINDHNYGRGWGPITYLEGVQRSSNVAFAYMLEQMGTDAWREYMDKFKFGVKTGIALPNESSGKILYDWPIEKVTSVYGQGTTVTAMQMIQAMTAIGNDGKMMKPYVVDKIVNPNDGTVIETEPEMAGQPISKETAKQVREVLETVILPPHGTGQLYQLEGYKVAGKTGTAQIADPKGGYLKGQNNFIFSFLGLAPADDPKLIMYVVVEQPQLDEYENGGVPVSMIFNPVMKNSLQYLNIKPEKIPNAKITKMPDFTKMNVKEAEDFLAERSLDPVILGSGKKIVGQLPKDGVPMIEGEKIIIRTDGEFTVPDMTGWSKRDVLKIAHLAGLKINIVGSGFVYKQNLKPNSPIQEGTQLVVNFETPMQKIEREKIVVEVEDGEEPPLD